MQNNIEATKFLEEQLNKIYSIHTYSFSNHGINIHFILNVNQLDLSKRHPDELYFYDKEGKYLMDYNKNTNTFWLSYYKIWSKLKKEFELNDQEIRELTKGILEKQFKCKVSTAWCIKEYWRLLLEKQFKCKVSTAIKLNFMKVLQLEQQFKCKVSTAFFKMR